MPEPATESSATRDRILDATVALAGDTGLRKVSMDEVSSRAGLSRATVYLHFAGRQALLDAAVERELGRFFAYLREVGDRYPERDERVVETFAASYRWLREHPVLRAVLRINPQLLIPYVFGEAPALALGRAFSATLVDLPSTPGHVTPEEFGDQVVRHLLTLVVAPYTLADLDAPGQVEAYARRYLLPII